MKIDWKHLATTPGYISLKAAYIRDVEQSKRTKHPMRDKKVFLKQFNWVIARAKHYAYHGNLPIEEILNCWEALRKYWWLNFYQDSHQPKLKRKSLRPRKPKRPISKKDPARWPAWRKAQNL